MAEGQRQIGVTVRRAVGRDALHSGLVGRRLKNCKRGPFFLRAPRVEFIGFGFCSDKGDALQGFNTSQPEGLTIPGPNATSQPSAPNPKVPEPTLKFRPLLRQRT